MSEPRLVDGLYKGGAAFVETINYSTPFGSSAYAVLWNGRDVIGYFATKEIANGIAATFDALTPEGTNPNEPPVDALLDLVGFRQILAAVVEREAKRLAAEEMTTRAAAARLRGRRWP